MNFSLLPSYGALMLTMILFSRLSKPLSSKQLIRHPFYLFMFVFFPSLIFFFGLELFRKLKLAYLDLYLIHWPVRLKQDVEGFNFTGEDVIPFDIKGTWKAMEDCYRLGLVKSIGISNFGIKKLSLLLENASVSPAVNQV
jgi:hypothetical protein